MGGKLALVDANREALDYELKKGDFGGKTVFIGYFERNTVGMTRCLWIFESNQHITLLSVAHRTHNPKNGSWIQKRFSNQRT